MVCDHILITLTTRYRYPWDVPILSSVGDVLVRVVANGLAVQEYKSTRVQEYNADQS